MRKLLGLEDDDNDNFMIRSEDQNNNDDDDHDHDDDSFFGGGNDDVPNESNDELEEVAKSFTFVPGKQNLEEKIRTKLNEKKRFHAGI